MQLRALCIYPIKSVAGICLDRAELSDTGLQFDRQFMLIDANGQFITGRRFPALVQVNAVLQPAGLSLYAPGMLPLAIHYRQLRQQYQPVTIWGHALQAQAGDPAWDAWFSDYLGSACRLVFFGQQSHRLTQRGQQPVAFADGYPLLLTSRDSLADLNRRLHRPVGMARFRPNLIIEGAAPFAEDGWQRIRIGAIEFDVVKPCSRCIFTTVDPDSGEADAEQQPLATLKRFRRNPDGEIDFGMNLIARSRGLLRRGDPVEVLARRDPQRYADGAPYRHRQTDEPQAGSTPEEMGATVATGVHRQQTYQQRRTSARKETGGNVPLRGALLPQGHIQEEVPMTQVTLLFDDLDTLVTGNTQDTILEQAEQAGLELPYSCRTGTCGTCRMKLISGEVEILEDAGLSQQELDDNQILICSCIPKTDLVLNQV